MKIIVTGASSGLGKEICKQALKMGYYVIGIARDFSKSNLTHPHFKTYSIDLSNLDTLKEKLDQIAAEEKEVDALILNAGKGLFGHIEQLSYSEIIHLINLNFLSAVFTTKVFLPNMKKKKSGTLIFIGSEAALEGKTNGSIYCASKFALRGFAQSLRKECLKSQVRVSLINPGMIETSFFDSLYFSPGPLKDNACNSEEIAHIAIDQLKARSGFVYEEINLAPLNPQIVLKKRKNLELTDSKKASSC